MSRLSFDDATETVLGTGVNITPVTSRVGRLPMKPSYYEVDIRFFVLAEHKDEAAELIDEFMDKMKALNAAAVD